MLHLILALLAVLTSSAAYSADTAAKQSQQGLTVFAADSMREALDEVIKSYKAATMQTVHTKFGPSAALAKEIQSGAKVSLFISDHEDEIKLLGQHNKTKKGTRATMLSNTLAVVAAADSKWSLTSGAQLAEVPFRSLLVQDPGATSIGKYAKDYLSGQSTPQGSVWDRSSKRLKVTTDPLKALTTDKNAVAIVYGTEAKKSKSTKILLEIPATEFKTYYSQVIVENQNNDPRILELYNFLQSKASKEVFARHGFGTPRPSEGRSRPGPSRPERKSPKPGAGPGTAGKK